MGFLKPKIPQESAEARAAREAAAASRIDSIQQGLSVDTERLQRYYGARMAVNGGAMSSPIAGFTQSLGTALK